MAKFVEKDYEKIARLIKLRREFASRVQHVDAGIKQERAHLDREEATAKADEWFSRRLDAGLYCLQV
jgi:beta-catenin-like protein 1